MISSLIDKDCSLYKKISKPFFVGAVSRLCVKHFFLAEGELSVWFFLNQGEKLTVLFFVQL